MQICGAVKAFVPICQIVVSFIGAAFDSEAFSVDERAHFARSAIKAILAWITFAFAGGAGIVDKFIISDGAI